MGKVFISYSHVDSVIANELTAALAQLGIEYFLDVKDINWGDPITIKVRQSLASCNAILVVISPASLKSHWVPYEIGYASALEKPILPFLTHPSLDVPHYIRDLAFATTITRVREYFRNTYPQLIEPGGREAGGPGQENAITLNLSQIEVLREVGRADDDTVRAELIAKVMRLSEERIELHLRELKEMGLVSELSGPWSGAYELSESGKRYLRANSLG